MLIAGNEFNEFRAVELGELSTIVNGLERKGGNQCLHNTFVKETYGVMGHCLLNFINTSLSYGRIPAALKPAPINSMNLDLRHLLLKKSWKNAYIAN
ncbi:hypothetical protein HHI36_009374 [Cryptolaemus montrouzieri]|uniref:Uncharacterized protein n=1 Tax=Cryptolaemus montrouzieri TaxID=559131 RepID=A0ABD2MW22_9CUCU